MTEVEIRRGLLGEPSLLQRGLWFYRHIQDIDEVKPSKSRSKFKGKWKQLWVSIDQCRGGCNLALPAIRGVEKTWTAAGERLEVSGLLIALAGWNPFNPPWNVNCPFPFPSDQGGHDKTNCRPVILSIQGPESQKTTLTLGWVFSHQNTTATGLLARDRESTFGFSCSYLFGSLARLPKRGRAYGWKGWVVEWSVWGCMVRSKPCFLAPILQTAP